MTFENLKEKIGDNIHFIGVGGIGMSALALLLRKINITVQGSDLSQNYMTKTLQDAGVKYFLGHKKENITSDLSLIIKTSIIKDDNEEIIAAKEKGIKIMTRAQLLALIMSYKKGITIAGTHGKTSTTAITSLMLEFANLDPIVINGGIINYFKSNFKLANGEFLVAESDESDGSFVDLPSYIGAITNIEPEHLEFYDGDFEKVKKYFQKYVSQIPQNGLCVICIDDFEARKIYQEFAHQKNIMSYSFKENADIMAKNIKQDASGSSFDAVFKDGRIIKNLHISAFGIHNVSNSLIAIAIADFLKIQPENIALALKNFNGVKRRFTKTGEVDGVAIIDDYAHHPTEISATINSAKQLAQNNKVILVLQPHKYTRVRDLFNEFVSCIAKADIVILADIYSANQEKIEGINQDSLFLAMQKNHKNIIKLDSEKNLAKIVKSLANKGDIVLCAGAGTITNWANNLPEELKE
jgi:UDP-N-acetylmuramate--alanine ligase